MITFKILGEPSAKQSFKFAVRPGKDGKNFVSKYQPKKVVENHRNLAWDVKSQLPKGFVPFDCPLELSAMFVFSPPKSWIKKKMKEFEEGTVFYKDTKSDLDNLTKQLLDSMADIVFVNDARIVKMSLVKCYGKVPRTEVMISEMADATRLSIVERIMPVQKKFEESFLNVDGNLPKPMPDITEHPLNTGHGNLVGKDGDRGFENALRCKECNGTGWNLLSPCAECGGTGNREVTLIFDKGFVIL